MSHDLMTNYDACPTSSDRSDLAGGLVYVYAIRSLYREALFPGLDLDSGLDWTLDWTLEKMYLMVPLFCQRGQRASAMLPGLNHVHVSCNW